ncbi:MAG: ABC-2 transporter permease [Saprospiraceae bacterium]
MNQLNLSITRLKLLLSREINTNKKSFLYSSLGVLGAMCIPLFIMLIFKEHSKGYFNLESMISFCSIFGLIWASLSFSELIQTSGKQFYLSLPASAEEKILSKWIIVIIIPILVAIFYFIIGTLATFIFNTISIHNMEYMSISINDFLSAYPAMILTNSLFLLGSVWMPKYSIFKTGMVIFGSVIMIAIIGFIFFRIIFFKEFQSLFEINGDVSLSFNPVEYLQSTWLKYTLGCLLTIFFIVVSYFKLKEKEL